MAEELKTVLGFDATAAIKTLATMEKQLIAWTAAMNSAANATGSFNRNAKTTEASIAKQTKSMTGQVQATKKAGTATKQFAKDTNIVSAAMDKYGKTATKIPATHPAFAKHSKAVTKAAVDTKKASKDMILSWKSVIRIFAIQVIHQMVSKITASLGEAVRNTIELENRFAEIQTIGGSLKNDFEGLSDEIRVLSDQFVIQTEIVAEGIYQTLSNQVADAGQAFAFFSAAAQFSIAAVTSADSAVNLLSSTINAFGYNAAQAEVIGGKLFKTIELGRIRGEEFADTFGRVAVLARNLGVSLDETLAAIATLTISGLKYNEAFTLITNTMLKLIKPTDALKSMFTEMGIVSAEAGIQAFGYLGFLDMLAEAAGGTATEIGELFSRVRAIRGILGLTGEAAEKAAKNLEAIREAGSKDLFEAKEIVYRTNAKQIQLEIEELRNVLLFDFGRPALDTLLEITKTFGGLVSIVKQLTLSLGVAAVAGAGLAVVLYPVAAAYVAIGLSFTAAALTYQELTKTALTGIAERLRAEKQAIHEINIAESELAEFRIRRNHEQFSELQKYLIEYQKVNKGVIDNSREAEEYVSTVFKDQLKDKLSSFESYVDELSDIIKNAQITIATNQRQIIDIERTQEGALFNIKINHLNDYQKYEASLQRSRHLRFQAEEEARAGRFKDAEALIAQAKTAIQIGLSLDAQLGNTHKRSDAESNLRGIYAAELEIKRDENRLDENRIRFAKKEYAEEAARLDRISALTKKISEFKVYDKSTGKMLFPTLADAEAGFKPLTVALKKEFDAIGKDKTVFKRLNLEQHFREIIKPFEDVFTRRPISIEFLYEQRLNEVFADIEKLGKDHPPEIEVKLVALGLDISNLQGIQDASKGLPKIEEELTKATRATVDFKGEQQELKNITDAQAFSIEALKNAITNFRKTVYVTLPTGQVLPMEEPLEGTEEKLRIIASQAARANEEVQNFTDPEKFKEALYILNKQAITFDEIGATDISQGLREYIKNLERAAKLIETIRLTQDQMKRRTQLESVLHPQSRAFGGMIYRQLGGFTPQGTDTVPAMLSPGEFVVNADATKKFYSQLVAINSGVKPIFRERGGPVTNVGDVNITVTETASAKSTARETMTAFRRETRRHTSRSF